MTERKIKVVDSNDLITMIGQFERRNTKNDNGKR